ncbi:L-fucose/L-arabinose isomerase family protein [Aliiroseovarius sp.]|uniref:L-fucose/L-arabinose isomerase family protein n=1 Tax=Aliiroseovarius sp. TaxID=1872442 RepID=UPI003BA97E10
MRLGILPLGRPTFDVPFAEDNLAAMLAVLEASGHELIGPRRLLFDEDTTRAAIAELRAARVEQILILQVTFSDASMTVAIGAAFDQPLSVWAVPEPRLGGRLRLNAFCGLNLASHALALSGRGFGWLYADPTGNAAGDLAALLAGRRPAGKLELTAVPEATDAGQRVAQAVNGRRIARIGEHPVGFDTCAYDKAAMKALAGVEVEELALDDLFDTARAVPAKVAASLRAQAEADLAGLDEVNPDELDRSLRLKAGLDTLRDTGGYDAFAIRCWPETFTDYGGAVCGPAAMMGEGRVPCACEADVYGALTQLVLMEAAQAPVFLTDLVDMDGQDDTGVVWHCGQAPMSMRDPDVPAEATIHTNRKQPLLYQFPLKPGEVTLMRISQAHGRPHMVLSHAEMLKRPMAFTGTSGVLRFDRPAGEVLNDIIASGLEHHMALVYGDHREVLRGTAGAMGLPLLEL